MTSGRKPGRPTKFTPQLGEEVCQLVEAGNYIETAAACCGINRTTIREWIREGQRQKRGQKHDFSNAIKAAEARAEARALNRIRVAAAQAWQADAWYLERKYPQRWGRQLRVEDDAPAAVVHITLPDNGRMPSDGQNGEDEGGGR